MYLKLEVSLHGLPAQTQKEVLTFLEELKDKIYPERNFNNDITIELIESAGVKDASKSDETQR